MSHSTHPRSAAPSELSDFRNTAQSWTVILLQAATVLGYPLTAIFVTISGDDTNFLAVMYRVVICIVSSAVIFYSLGNPISGRLPKMLWIFLAIYTVRLLNDWLFADIIGADFSLLFFAGVTLLPVAALHLSAIKGTHDTRLGKVIVGFGTLFLILTIFVQINGIGTNPWATLGEDAARFGTERLNPISIGAAAGSVILAALYLLADVRTNGKLKLFALVAMVLGAYVMLLGNSRGPMIGVAVAALWFASIRMRRLLFIMPVVLIVLAIFWTDVNLADKVYGRFMVDYLSDASVATRLVSQEAAIEAFLTHPILGAFYLDPALGIGYYPHNIIIESAMALGIFGFTLLLVIIFRSVWNIATGFGNEHRFYTLLFIQYAILSLSSGNLWSADTFFYLLGLPLILGARGVKHRNAPLLVQTLAHHTVR